MQVPYASYNQLGWINPEGIEVFTGEKRIDLKQCRHFLLAVGLVVVEQ